jgi:hypothetical protein
VGEIPDPCSALELLPTVELEDALVFVNEVLVLDSSASSAGAFVELLHTSEVAVELEGASLTGNAGLLVEFGTHRMEPGDSLVLCGSLAAPEMRCDLQVEGDLILDWAGEHLEIRNSDGERTDDLYLPPAVPGTSLNRSPDGEDTAPLVRHDDLSPTGLASSPGTRVDGSSW